MVTALQQTTNLLDIEEIQREDARRCKASFAYFLRQAWRIIEPAKDFVEGYHVDACTRHLQALAEGEIHRLCVNMPPGTGKSTMFSVAYPAWIWTRNPYEKFLCASYAMDLSVRDRHNCRMLIESEWYQNLFGDVFQMLPDQNQKSFYENTARGFMQATATFASGTGKRCTSSIIDDSNNAMAGEAEVAATRDWFSKTWIPRLNDRETGKMILACQRLYSEDLTAMVLELGGWEHCCLPMEYEPSRKSFTSIGWCDPRTDEGQLLCPELVNEKGVAELKHSQGSFHYSAQQQQAPVPATGGTFQQSWARYFEIQGDYYVLHTKYGRTKSVPIRACQVQAVCDLAVSEREQADFFVIQTWATTPSGEILLLHQLRGHFTNPDQQKKAVEIYERFRWMIFWTEDVAYQLSYVQQLKSYEKEEEVAPGLYRKRIVNIPVRPWHPFRDKVARAGVAAVKMEAGDMYFLLNAQYLTELEPEVFKFPKSKKKDIVDCLSMICDVLSNPQIPLSGEGDGMTTYYSVQDLGPEAAAQLSTYTDAVSIARATEEDLARQIEDVRRQLAAVRSEKKG